VEIKHHSLLTIAAVCLFTGCSKAPEPAPVLGHAYVGPATLQIRKELAARAPLVATVSHGEKLELIGRRRRFYEVRTGKGAEGWVDGRQLLSPESMAQIGELARQVAAAPGQGRATVFDALNVHTEPNRQAPSFFQMTMGKYVDVIAYQRAPRIPFQAPELIPAAPAPPKRPVKKKKEPAVPPPPPGKAPAVPAGWLALSGNPTGQIKPAPASAPVAQQAPMEDWALVRDENGRAGWALARALFMAVPDEIAQYAERARISAYFSIGTIENKGDPKQAWLWAALTPGVADRDFDSLRIFTFNTRRRRYETAFIERNIRGWLPIQLRQSGGTAQAFRVVAEEKNGTVMEREYSLSGFRARITARKPAERPQPYWTMDSTGHGKPNPAAGPRETGGWTGKAQEILDGFKDRLKR
jgi:SH3-like domain-containing protein